MLNNLEAVYENYLRHGPGPMIREWKQRSVVLGRTVELIQEGRAIPATALDVCEDGRLRVRFTDGTVRDILSGEISLRF
jgi:Biotin protein ligase C terminal domain.